jgi:hypothetical protein
MYQFRGLPARLLFSTLLLAPSPFSAAQNEASPIRGHLGVGVKASFLGAGVEAATPFTRRSDLRVGFNTFRYARNFHKDGINYAGRLNFQSVEAHYDWFPFYGAFHVSPGILVYNGNELRATALVPAGQRFTLNSTNYVSDSDNPVTGSGRIGFRRAGPMISAGWGNLLPRNGRHFSIPLEIGAIYTGAPRATLILAGSACDATGVNCRTIASDPTVKSNVQAEKDKLNREMAPYKFYPVISVGFGVSF